MKSKHNFVHIFLHYFHDKSIFLQEKSLIVFVLFDLINTQFPHHYYHHVVEGCYLFHRITITFLKDSSKSLRSATSSLSSHSPSILVVSIVNDSFFEELLRDLFKKNMTMSSLLDFKQRSNISFALLLLCYLSGTSLFGFRKSFP